MKSASLGAALAVLLIHTAVFAQQQAPTAPAAPPPAQPAPAPAPQPAPAPAPQPAPAPPPGAPQPPPAPILAPPPYPYGPPPGYRQPPPPSYYYFPPPPPRGIWRPFTISLGLGIGWLSLPDPTDDGRASDTALKYLARVGFGVARDWVVFVGLDGAQTSRPDYTITLNDFLLGAQYFIVPILYVRAGLGIATINVDSTFESASGRAGQAFLAAAGVELFQGDNVALGVEWASALSRLPSGSYLDSGINLALSFY
jgi:hypothetical protein